MSTEKELLDAVYAAPLDDGPRVVYGDFLLGKGDPRGEFIQVQCRLADPAISESEHRKLRATENKLIKEHGESWKAPVLDTIGRTSPLHMFMPVKIEFRRGFVDYVRTATETLKNLDALFAVAPLITQLRLDPSPPYEDPPRPTAADFQSPHLAKIQSLEVNWPGAGNELAEAIAACPHFTNLKEIILSISRWDIPNRCLTVSSARALASSVHLANVETLMLDDNRLEDDGVAALVESVRWKLKKLSVAGNLVGDQGVLAIAQSAASETLTSLNLARSTMKADTAAKLASSRHLGALEELILEDVSLKAKGAKAFLDALNLKSLRHLSLESTDLGDDIGVVAKSPKLLQLRVLNVRKNGIGKKAMAEFALSENLANLEKILAYDRESAEAREAFLSSPHLAKAEIYFRGKLLSRAAKEEGAKARAEKVAKKTPKKKTTK